MKKQWKAIFSFVFVLLLVGIGLDYLTDLTERKESRNKFSGFYEQDADYDVLFLGSSHVLNGIFPMELWNEYGMVSYNMGTHGGRTPASYWLLRNALEYTTPKLVVVDCYMISLNEKISEPEKIHMATDHIPFSKTKVEMVQDLAEGKGKVVDYLWNFSIYHNRWNDLKQEDFEPVSGVEKGAEARIGVAVPQKSISVEPSEIIQEETVGIEYLRRIIEECQNRDVEVLLTYLPFPDDSGWQKESNTVWELAKEYDVNYLDYHSMMEQVNVNTDFYDANSHLNPSGARKLTRYVGNYISNVYGIEDHREDDAYEGWHEDYQKYTELKQGYVRSASDVNNYLILLKDSGLSYGIYINPGLDLDGYPVLKELLLNIEVDYERMAAEGKCFLLVDHVNHTQNMAYYFEPMDTCFGELSLEYTENGELELRSKEEASPLVLTYADIGVIVFDNSNLSVVHQAKFKGGDTAVNMRRQDGN